MSRAVTWEYLNAEQVHRCMSAPDKADIVAVLLAAHKDNQSKLYSAPTLVKPLREEQQLILQDMYVHLIRFAQGMGFSPEKVSTLVGIVVQSHFANMAARTTNVQAYKDFEARLIAHSVHRPPFSAQVFSLTDGKAITDFMLNSYFRHYKLYQYAFTPRQIAEVKTVNLATPHNVPPASLVSMVKSVPLAQWEATQDELRRQEEERLAKIAEDEAIAAAEAERLALEEGRPNMTMGLRSQLDAIKSTVTKMSRDRLDDIEAKLIMLEGRMAEVNKPLSAGPKGPVKPPSRK